jgi:hypothetical protein
MPELGVETFVTERLRQGVVRALATDAEWIWVLDGSAVPGPGALDALLASLERIDGLPQPSVLTGVVLTPDGRVDPDRTPWYRRFQLDVALTSADRSLLPVRGTPGPALVHRWPAALDLPRDGAPIGPRGVLEWTTRVLRHRTGYLVPDSESEALGSGGDPLLAPATAARLLLGRAIVGTDRVGFVLELCERAGLR